MKSEDLLSATEARALWSYDPATGVLRWRVSRGKAARGDVAGTPDDGYLTVGYDGMKFYVHRVAWLIVHGAWPVGRLDHRDEHRANNRLANLRAATASLNGANRGKTKVNTSGFKGVYESASGKWYAMVGCRGQRVYCGSHATPEEAHAAYLAKAVELHGEFAHP